MLDTEQLSEIIAQVLKKMNIEGNKITEKKKALVIFEDFQKEYASLEDLKQLKEEYNVSILTVKNASGIITPAGFEKTFVIEELPLECNLWIKQFERVLIPSPSLKIVSKLAHVIVDDKFIEIIFLALKERKQVLIGQALDNGKAMNFAAPLKNEIQRLADKLKDFGIEQLSAEKSLKNYSPVTNDFICKTRGLISLQDVINMVGNSNELSIVAGTVITPLAMDYIREKKISLTQKS
ncbi:MAG: hypothetical protein ACYDG2_23605 [Ruminiclostridium sp.]